MQARILERFSDLDAGVQGAGQAVGGSGNSLSFFFQRILIFWGEDQCVAWDGVGGGPADELVIRRAGIQPDSVRILFFVKHHVQTFAVRPHAHAKHFRDGVLVLHTGLLEVSFRLAALTRTSTNLRQAAAVSLRSGALSLCLRNCSSFVDANSLRAGKCKWRESCRRTDGTSSWRLDAHLRRSAYCYGWLVKEGKRLIVFPSRLF